MTDRGLQRLSRAADRAAGARGDARLRRGQRGGRLACGLNRCRRRRRSGPLLLRFADLFDHLGTARSALQRVGARAERPRGRDRRLPLARARPARRDGRWSTSRACAPTARRCRPPSSRCRARARRCAQEDEGAGAGARAARLRLAHRRWCRLDAAHRGRDHRTVDDGASVKQLIHGGRAAHGRAARRRARRSADRRRHHRWRCCRPARASPSDARRDRRRPTAC